MQQAVDEYFHGLTVGPDGERLLKPRKPTLSGLALALGFQSLWALTNYESYPDLDYKWVIDNARLRIMEYLEEHGKTGFDTLHLKNLDPTYWRDRTEQAIEDTRQLMSEKERAARLEALVDKVRARVTAEKVINSIPGELEDDDSWMG